VTCRRFPFAIISTLLFLSMVPAAAHAETVLITGANSGIGLEFTKQYLTRGWTVIATHRRADVPPTLAELDAFLAKLEGRLNRVRLWDFDVPGSAKTFTNAAAAAGTNTMTLTGASIGDILAGEYIGGDGRPHLITDLAIAGSNLVATVKPHFETDIALGAATYQKVTGLFRLTSDDAANNFNAGLSSRGIFAKSGRSPISRSIDLRQSSMMVSVVRARKSILSIPVFSRSDMTNWVVSSSFCPLQTGTSS